MAFDIRAELQRHAGENYELHGQHLNRQMVRMLRTIGYDRFYEKGEGCYLIDASRMTECRIAGDGGPGASCSVQEDCEAGFFCGGLTASLQCIRLCGVMDDDCPSAEGRCVQQSHTPDGVGLCTMDATTARSMSGR